MSNMVIATNVMALNSHRSLKGVGAKQAQASARLSSGQKINSAADDAAGLAISEKMRSQIRGLDMASKNSQDSISLIQTAEGGMQEIDNMLQRIRELTVQVSNDTNEHNAEGTGDRKKMQDEIDALVAEIDSMSDRVEFNKKKLINGDAMGTTAQNEKIANIKSKLSLIGGTGAATSTAVSQFTAATATSNGAIGSAFQSASTAVAARTITDGLGVVVVISSVAAFAASNITDSNQVNTQLKALDAYLAQLKTSNVDQTAAITSIETQKKALKDMASAVQEITPLLSSKDALTRVNGNELYFQLGANAGQGITVSISSIKSNILGIGNGNGTTNINVLKNSGADINATIKTLDNALSYVTTERSKLGAVQNRLEYTQKSLDVSSENLSAAESRIRDTDMAKEMMKFTQSNVLQQAATSMLAQANQAPQNILSLLR